MFKTLRSASILILILLVSTLAAESMEPKFSGQIRYRFEAGDKDFVSATGFNSASLLRSRLNLKFAPTAGVTAVLQVQDSRNFGEELSTLGDGSADNLDLHQAYFVLNPSGVENLSLKVGRFEAVYGPQRLIGAVGWHNIGRSFDGIVATVKTGPANLDLFTMKDGLVDVSGIYANLKLVESMKTQAFYIADNRRGTAGTYLAGKAANFFYEAEFAYQLGEKTDQVSYAAMLGALNVGMKVGSMKFMAGMDYLSGDDTTTTDVDEMFNTLYATNHKYYGSMDYFLNLPVHTQNLGLMDIHFKAVLPAFMGITPKLAYHMFTSPQANAAGDNDFGSEVDISLARKYNKSMSWVAGYSMFMPGALKATDGDNGQWAYLMTIVNF